jgi:hypothetical protein
MNKKEQKEKIVKAVVDALQFLSVEQCKKVLEFIALMPGEGKGEVFPKNGDQEKDS